jgi:hypothetical protein
MLSDQFTGPLPYVSGHGGRKSNTARNQRKAKRRKLRAIAKRYGLKWQL